MAMAASTTFNDQFLVEPHKENADDESDYLDECEYVEKTSTQFSGNLLVSLMKLKCGGNFCDVTIKSGMFAVRAHKVILASATDYFSAMFMNETKEAKTGVVDFSQLLPKVVEQCIEFIYSGKLKISMHIAEELLDASEMMQLPELSKLCVEFLADRVDLKSCAKVLSLSHIYSKDSLNESLMKFLKCNFEGFMESDDFHNLDFDSLVYCFELLPKHEGNFEMHKWNGILTWTNEDDDAEGRKCLFPALFKLLNLQCMPKSFLTEVVWINEQVNDSLECFRMIRDTLITDSDKCDKPTVTIPTGSHEVSHIASFDSEQLAGYAVVCSNASIAKFPSKLNLDMDFLYYMGKLFVGTGLQLYKFSEGNWNKMDVDFETVRRNPYCITCSKCHGDHWYLGKKHNVYEVEGSQRSGSFGSTLWSTRHEGVILDGKLVPAQTCRICSAKMPKKGSNDSCYCRCIGVGKSVYMFTGNYVIEYNMATSSLIHHDVSTRLGNGFFLAASKGCIYALGGNGTGNRAVMFDPRINCISKLPNMKGSHSFCQASFKDGKLQVLDKHSGRIREDYGVE